VQRPAAAKEANVDTNVAAQLAIGLNFVTLIVVSLWLFVPWTRDRSVIEALTPLVVIHGGRTVALQLFSAQANGLDMPDGLRDQIVWGDQLGFLLALLTMLALWRRSALARPLTWLLVAATAIDLANALVGGIRNDLLGQTTDVAWLILTFYVPLLWVSIGLMTWLLVTRPKEDWS
jgi:hypothetical protein